jgi:two-component system sensor histidine kinase/response regulator
MARVLVVEDDDSTRGLIIRILMHDGHAVDVAPDGEVAITKLTENEYDAVILDFMMPRVDGAGVLGYMASDKRHMLAHTVLCTAYTEAADQKHALDSARLMVHKPFDVPTLLAALSSALTEP